MCDTDNPFFLLPPAAGDDDDDDDDDRFMNAKKTPETPTTKKPGLVTYEQLISYGFFYQAKSR